MRYRSLRTSVALDLGAAVRVGMFNLSVREPCSASNTHGFRSLWHPSVLSHVYNSQNIQRRVVPTVHGPVISSVNEQPRCSLRVSILRRFMQGAGHGSDRRGCFQNTQHRCLTFIVRTPAVHSAVGPQYPTSVGPAGYGVGPCSLFVGATKRRMEIFVLSGSRPTSTKPKRCRYRWAWKSRMARFLQVAGNTKKRTGNMEVQLSWRHR